MPWEEPVEPKKIVEIKQKKTGGRIYGEDGDNEDKSDPKTDLPEPLKKIPYTKEHEPMDPIPEPQPAPKERPPGHKPHHKKTDLKKPYSKIP